MTFYLSNELLMHLNYIWSVNLNQLNLVILMKRGCVLHSLTSILQLHTIPFHGDFTLCFMKYICVCNTLTSVMLMID